jgi:hypothetical protein
MRSSPTIRRQAAALLLLTYSDRHRSTEVLDARLASIGHVAAYCESDGWRIDWTIGG